MTEPDMDVIKEMPGYKQILKSVLKSQIQQLVDQLSSYTDEETVILTASMSDGTLSHLGSDYGKIFLENNENVKSQFLKFCMKVHQVREQEKKEEESRKKVSTNSQLILQLSSGPRPKNTQKPPRSQPSGQQNAFPVTMFKASSKPKGQGIGRYEPYKKILPKPAEEKSEMMPDIKIEPESTDETVESNALNSGYSFYQQKPQPGLEDDTKSNSSSSTITSYPLDIMSQDAQFEDSYDSGSNFNFGGPSQQIPRNNSNTDQPETDSGTPRIKIEAKIDDEEEFEIIDVEPGPSSVPFKNRAPTVQSGIDRSLAAASTMADIPGYISSNTDSEDMESELKNIAVKNKPGGGRFKRLGLKELDDLEQNRHANSTKRNTLWGLNIFQDWYLGINGEIVDFHSLTGSELNDLLRRFYAEAVPKHADKRNQRMGAVGGEYHKNTLKNIRAAINRHLHDIGLDFDIVRDKQFRSSNNMLDAKHKSNLKRGLSVPTIHRGIISESDLIKISSYLNVNNPNPIILRYKVWYDLAIHFVSPDFHALLTPKSFHFKFDDMNKEYVTLTRQAKEKIYCGDIESEEGPYDRRMYETNDLVTCPVHALRFLLGKTDPQATSLFNCCSKAALQTPEIEAIWYVKKSVKNYLLSRYLRDITKQAKCSRQYASHSLRATAIQILSNVRFES